MKILVSTAKGGLDDEVNPLFGRCQTFTIVDVDEKGKKINGAKVVPNPAWQQGGGAGIAAAQKVADIGASAVITGNCGPNAMVVLKQAGIKVYAASGKVKAAVGSFLANKLENIDSQSVPGHFGMGAGIGLGGGRGRRGGFGGGRG